MTDHGRDSRRRTVERAADGSPGQPVEAASSSTDRPVAPASVIVLAYNSAATLESCLTALRPQVDELGAELIVVDNNSADDSAEVAAGHATRVVRSATNRGFAGGCNLGVAHSNGEVVVLVNPDARLDPGCLRAVVAAAGDGTHGPVGGRAHHADGSFDQRCTMGRPRLRGAVSFALGIDTLLRGSSWFDPEHGLTELAVDAGVVAVEAVSGALMALDRTLWQQLGGLDEDYFVYGEDVDVCVRAHAAGSLPAVASSAAYTHAGGMATDPTIQRRILLYRGKVDLYRRHLPPAAAHVAVVCLQAGVLLRGLPTVLPLRDVANRARPWLELFWRRREWRGGHVDRG